MSALPILLTETKESHEMQFDPTTLGFNFAKDLAIQLITLSTGLLALSITFTKEIVKTLSNFKEIFLRISWGFHMLSILFGVWTLMALTGTLMPLQPNAPGKPLQFQFGSNVRGPAAGQVALFLLGTLLLVFVYGSGPGKSREEEYQVINEAPDKLATTLKNLKMDNWELVSMTAQDPTRIVALVKRNK